MLGLCNLWHWLRRIVAHHINDLEIIQLNSSHAEAITVTPQSLLARPWRMQENIRDYQALRYQNEDRKPSSFENLGSSQNFPF
jgi:hypothetical protein